MDPLAALGARLTAGRLVLRTAVVAAIPAVATAVLLLLPWRAFDAAMDERPGARITDRSGILLALMPGREGTFQERAAGPDIPAASRSFEILLEDRRFKSHPGIDPLALVRALAQRVAGGGSRSGASTITMQLARIVHPHVRSFAGKLVEAWDALRLESRLTKDQILDLYLNEVPFGRNTRGVGAAAWTYFGGDLRSLTPAQLLALAIIPRNPTVYDPLVHPDALITTALEADRRLGLGVDPDDIRAAINGARSGRPPGAAPHFARFVAGLVNDGNLMPKDGRVVTTLDLKLNETIEARVRFILDRYAAARVTNAAVVVLDNETDSVLGWVGSRDFQDAERSGQIDGVLIRRQSASTLKPFLYASAIQGGWTAATLLPDVPLVFGAADEVSYRPQNFDKRSHGVVRVRTALASSLNVPAVYTLSHVGLDPFIETLRALGFSLPGDAAARYGLGTAIGNAEVSLLDLAHAFTVFARGGTIAPLAVTPGRTQGHAQAGARIFDPVSAWIIADILSDPSARVTGFGTHTYFRAPFPTMFKSGTSSEFTNLWCLGATPRFTVGVWAGNFDGRAVINKTGSIVPTQIVTDALRAVTDLFPSAGGRDFPRPPGVVAVRICTTTGEAATGACGPTRVEYFRSTTEVPRPRAAGAAPPTQDELLQEQFLDSAHRVRILFPVNGQVFYRDQTVLAGGEGIPVLIAAPRGQQVSVKYDGQERAAGAYPLELTIPLSLGPHSLVVSTADGIDRVSFEIR